jgi:hypothetical protein
MWDEPADGKIPSLLLFPTKFHFAFIWEQSSQACLSESTPIFWQMKIEK